MEEAREECVHWCICYRRCSRLYLLGGGGKVLPKRIGWVSRGWGQRGLSVGVAGGCGGGGGVGVESGASVGGRLVGSVSGRGG